MASYTSMMGVDSTLRDTVKRPSLVRFFIANPQRWLLTHPCYPGLPVMHAGIFNVSFQQFPGRVNVADSAGLWSRAVSFRHKLAPVITHHARVVRLLRVFAVCGNLQQPVIVPGKFKRIVGAPFFRA